MRKLQHDIIKVLSGRGFVWKFIFERQMQLYHNFYVTERDRAEPLPVHNLVCVCRHRCLLCAKMMSV